MIHARINTTMIMMTIIIMMIITPSRLRLQLRPEIADAAVWSLIAP
jgi:hypothetical protein